jgi:hypothetical protein
MSFSWRSPKDFVGLGPETIGPLLMFPRAEKCPIAGSAPVFRYLVFPRQALLSLHAWRLSKCLPEGEQGRAARVR